MIKGIILAGGYFQYRMYLHERKLDPAEYINANNSSDFCGLPQDIKFIKHGSWYKRQENLIQKFDDYAIMSGGRHEKPI